MTAACHGGHHEPRHAGVHVAVVPGERRIAGYRVVNDAWRSVHVVPKLGPVVDLSTGHPVAATPWSVVPAAAFDLAPGHARELRLALDADGLLVGHVYRTELELHGTSIEPVPLLVRVEAAAAVVGRHDCSRLRAWVRGCCFGHDVRGVDVPGQRPHVCGTHRW